MKEEKIINVNDKFEISGDIVARIIDDEIIIVPLTSGIGDLEDELYSLNGTGRAIWDKIDGIRTIRDIAEILSQEFDESSGHIEVSIIGLLSELSKRGIIVCSN